MILGVSPAFGVVETYFQKETLDVPYREQAIIVGENGFYPNRIIAYQGERVRFFVTSAGVKNACFNIPDKNVFSGPSEGKILEVEAFFDKSGVFQFNCPNSAYVGRVMVLEKAADKEERLRRGLASDVTKVWRPKDEPREWSAKTTAPMPEEEVKRFREDYIDLDQYMKKEVPNVERFRKFSRDLAQE